MFLRAFATVFTMCAVSPSWGMYPPMRVSSEFSIAESWAWFARKTYDARVSPLSETQDEYGRSRERVIDGYLP